MQQRRRTTSVGMENHRHKERRSHICIVDDEQVSRTVLNYALKNEGYELHLFASRDELFEYLEMNVPDVILLDVMMPERDGFSVCRQLKQDRRYQHIPIVLITALTGQEALLRGLDAGADEFLSKPVNALELRARVRTTLRIKMQYDALQDALALREDLTHMVVHDMKHPIASAIAHCYLAQGMDDITPQMQTALDAIQAQLRRLLGFADDILTIARIEDGKFRPTYLPTDLRQIVETVVHEQQVLARLVNIHLDSDLPLESPPQLLDGKLIQRVLENLLSNAIKYSAEGSTVTVRLTYAYTEEEDSVIRLQVLDQGPGIDPTYRDLIFDKFAIAPLKQSGVAQTGLGLTFSKKAVEAHNGKIFVTENQPQGSVFTVELYPKIKKLRRLACQ
jgi:signal transduction histidine kinase